MRYWLSFDLGMRGNYEGIYEWLDEKKARECGDSVATFKTDMTREEIEEELSELLDDENVRVYLIDSTHGGRFILGRRKREYPWSGYAVEDEDVEGLFEE